MAQDPVENYEDTGRFTIPPRYMPRHRVNGMTKGDWIRILVWAVPVIFMAATMYVTMNHMSSKQTAQDEHLQKLDATTGDLSSEQKVLNGKVGEIEKKQDKMILDLEKVDDKIDEQSKDLAAIKEKLKIQAD